MTNTPQTAARFDLTRYARTANASAGLVALCDLVDSYVWVADRMMPADVLKGLMADIDRNAAKVEHGQAWAAMVAVAGAPVGWCPKGDCVVLNALRRARQRAEGLTEDAIWSRLPDAGEVAQ